MSNVRRAEPDDRDEVAALLADAFATDPVVRWFFPDDDRYPAQARVFFGYLFDVRVAVAGAWITTGGEATALWSPPGAAAGEWEDREWEQVTAELGPTAIARCDAWDAAVAPHHPDTAHWYLGVLGTAPAHQRRGHGPAVATPGLAAASAAGLPAFLETGVEENVALYERLGFVVIGVVEHPDLPRGWCMRRG
jgi:ribosomal protein S18 acetylase RimI-like enzyme